MTEAVHADLISDIVENVSSYSASPARLQRDALKTIQKSIRQ